MSVNSAFKRIFMNRVAVSTGVACIVLVVFLVASSFTKRSDRELMSKRANLTVREIGHRILLLSGDATSAVLPVYEIKEGTFRLEFENKFTFSHDSLISLSRRLLDRSQFPSGYTVTVHDCPENEIVYGFQVDHSSLNLLPCQGRSQSMGCYAIEVAFPDFKEKAVDYPLITVMGSGLMVLLAVAMLIGYRGKREVPTLISNDSQVITKDQTEMCSLGKFRFDNRGQRLLSGSEVISLTEKECKILELLNANFGELISRDTLMEKIWINEGVITGRSLDMFVSKLRKKLSGDPQLRITNVHGKGYKLELYDEPLSL